MRNPIFALCIGTALCAFYSLPTNAQTYEIRDRKGQVVQRLEKNPNIKDTYDVKDPNGKRVGSMYAPEHAPLPWERNTRGVQKGATPYERKNY